MELNIRALNADEIDCRVAMIRENGLSLLLYKDARVDQNILDETVGPMNWQRRHCRDNANCIVSLWDAEKGQWIDKEDTGTVSDTEAEKGLASDSFKRACFNWGIGRELYTAPFIWISAEKCTIKKNDKGRLACQDRFQVASIRTEGGKITYLAVINASRKGEVVFTYGGLMPEAAKQAGVKTEAPKLSPLIVKEIQMLAEKAGVPVEKILEQAKANSLEEISPKCAADLKKALQAAITRRAREVQHGAQGETA